ncbi:MAG: carbohydrate kinase family protein, partial [Clostridia bacterium]
MAFVAGTGRTNIDLIYAGLSRLPNEGEEIYSNDFRVELGGGTPATLVNLSRLNIPTKIATELGNDMFSNFARDKFKNEGISPLNLYDGTGYPLNISSAMITKNDRTFVSYGTKVAPTKSQIDAVYEMSRGAKIVIMQSGYLEAYKKLKKEGAIMIFDVGYTEDLSLEKIKDNLEIADYFVPNKLEALKITDTTNLQDAAKVLGKYLDKVIIKLDNEGCFGVDNGESFCVDKIDCFEKVDSTGAGDAFLAGFTYGIFNGYSFKKSILCGNIVGGNCVTEIGCLTAKINEEELKSKLNQYIA